MQKLIIKTIQNQTNTNQIKRKIYLCSIKQITYLYDQLLYQSQVSGITHLNSSIEH